MRRSHIGRRSRLALLAVGAGTAAVVLLALELNVLRAVEQNSVDARFELRGAQPAPRDLTVVAVDDVTFNELGLQWPFPRSRHAELIERLRRAGARLIAYDVQFTEPTVPREDNALIEAAGAARPVVLSTTEVDAKGESNIFGGEEVLRSIGARAGNTVVYADPGGVIRKMPYAVSGMEAFAIAAVKARGGRPKAGGGGDDRYLLDYRGPPGTIDTVSFSRVLSGDVPAEQLRGRMVVVGASAPSLQDVHATPFGGRVMSGAELQANAIWTVQHGFPLQLAAPGVVLLLIALMAFVAPLASFWLRPAVAIAAALGVGALYAAASQAAFEAGTVLPLAYPLMALVLATVGALAVHYVATAFQNQQTRDAFSRFVPQAVVDEVLERAGADLRLGGERLESTVLFSDIRGFTEFSETREPGLVVEVLNRYLSEMTDAIMDHGGTLVAYMGDGIMAVFGAPLPQDDHADRALASAREMLESRLPRFNEWLRARGLGEGLRIGIGVNSGVVMSGQVGSDRRVEYAAIGDTTNTAARLEAMTKETPYSVFVSSSTRDRLREVPEDLVFVEERDVRGRSGPIGIWTLRPATGS